MSGEGEEKIGSRREQTSTAVTTLPLSRHTRNQRKLERTKKGRHNITHFLGTPNHHVTLEYHKRN